MLREEHRSREQYTSSWLSLDNSGNTSSRNLFPLHPINSSFTGQSVTTAASQIKPSRGWQKEKKNQRGKMFGGEQKEWKQRESKCTCEKRAPGKSDSAVFHTKTLECVMVPCLWWRHILPSPGCRSISKFVRPFYSPCRESEVHIQLDVSLTRKHTQSGRCRGNNNATGTMWDES